MEECNNVYNKFEPLKDGIKCIADYIVQHSQNLFKLMKYKEPTDFPLAMADLSNKEKADMVCSDALEMYNVNATVNKNIIFQIDIDEAFWIASPQLRIEVGNFYAIDSYRGYAEINMEIIVPNKQRLFNDGSNTLCDRSAAMALELIKLLNGTVIPNSSFNSCLYIDRGAPNGTGRNTGCYRVKLNEGYSGYYLSFAVLV